MSLKIYTKTGDKGTTSLIGGKKVSKDDLRIDAYGNVDELNSFLGLLRDQDQISEQIKEQLFQIQHQLFNLGAQLAKEPGFDGFSIPEVKKEDVHKLEEWIDNMENELPELRNFILPGGHQYVSLCHVCRTVCRRTERSITALAHHEPIDEEVIPFVNRLSDYFFMLARKLGKDLNVDETLWQSGKP